MSVTIFTPNNRRVTVKIAPNMSLLEILEQGCSKFPQFDARMYDLKHNRNVLDLSQMFRFSGLPTNCELEMILAKKGLRTDEEITIVVQTEEGARLQGTFMPATVLSDVLEALCPMQAKLETNPVVVYMRKEVHGEELAVVTLKSLGLVSGKAMLRLIHKTPEQLKVQANVSGPLRVNKQPEDDKVTKTDVPIQVVEEEEKQEAPVPVVDKPRTDDGVPGSSRDPEVVPMDASEVAVSESRPVIHNINFTEEDLARLEEQTHVLDSRNTIIYSLESVVRVIEDQPESFFEVTANDMRSLIRQQRDEAKALNDQPLLTAKLRDEMEKSSKTLQQLQYKTSVIRIQFPDRLVLQAIFNPIDTVATIEQFVRDHLVDKDGSFHLFITPPKTILAGDKRLVELHCVPLALFHFGWTSAADQGSGPFLKPDYKLSTAAAADFLVAKIRGKITVLDNEGNEGKLDASEDQMEVSDDNERQPKGQRIVGGTFKTSSTAVTGSDKKVPKWFKTPK